MKFLSSLTMLLALSLSSWVVHAENGCPAGQIPHSGTDPSSCGPIPNYYNNTQQPQAPRVVWVSQWGAVATDSAAGALGGVTGLSSKQAAERAAMSDCQAKGGSNCVLHLSYDNECASMSVGDKILIVVSDLTLDKATQLSQQKCGEQDKNCRVYYSACSLPQRTQ